MRKNKRKALTRKEIYEAITGAKYQLHDWLENNEDVDAVDKAVDFIHDSRHHSVLDRQAMATVLCLGHLDQGMHNYYSWSMPATTDCMRSFMNVRRRFSHKQKISVEVRQDQYWDDNGDYKYRSVHLSIF